MMIVGAAIAWAGYTLAWWGWLAVTDRVPPGPPNQFWWPSIMDLVSPARMGNVPMNVRQITPTASTPGQTVGGKTETALGTTPGSAVVTPIPTTTAPAGASPNPPAAPSGGGTPTSGGTWS